MGTDGKQRMKRRSLTSHSPPAVRPGDWGPLLYDAPGFQNSLEGSWCPQTHWMNSDEPHLKNPNLLQLRTQFNKQVTSHRLPIPAEIYRLTIPVA